MSVSALRDQLHRKSSNSKSSNQGKTSGCMQMSSYAVPWAYANTSVMSQY